MEPVKPDIYQKQSQFTTLMEIDNAKVSKLIQDTQQLEFVSEGKFQILIQEEEQQQIHFIKVGDFTYSIYKELPIYVTQYEDYRSFIFPTIEGFYVILVEDKFAENYDVLDAIFSSVATQIYQNATSQEQQQETVQQQQQEDEKQFQNGNANEEKKQEDEEEEENKQNEQEDSNFVGSMINKAGKFISGGIIAGASLLTKGIESSGNFIDGRIKETKEVEIKPETFEKAEKIKNSSNKVMKISAATAGELISMNMKMAEYAGKQISNKIHEKENKSNIDDNDKYGYLKEVGRQAIGATVEIIDALDKAATFIGSQLGQTSRQIIKKKYGDQAAQLADIGIDTAANAGKTYKEVKGVGVKKMAKACAKETAKQTAKNY